MSWKITHNGFMNGCLKMNIIDNLTYQKLNFPIIYKNYFNQGPIQQIVDVKESGYEHQNKIIIISDDYISILKSLVPGIVIDKHRLEQAIEIHLVKDYETMVTDNQLNQTIEIRTLLPYRLNETMIMIVKKIQRQHLTHVKDILICKELSKFEQLMIKKHRFSLDEKYDCERIKKYFIKYSPDFKVNWKPGVTIKEIFNTSTQEELLLKISFYHGMIQELLNTSNKYEAQDYLVYGAIQQFKKEALEVLQRYIDEDFYYNYRLIQCYLQIESEFLNQIEIFKKTCINEELYQLFNIENETEKYLFLLNSKMSDLNLKVVESLQKLVVEVNNI